MDTLLSFAVNKVTMNELEVVIVLTVTMLGAIFSGWLGWLESGDPFDKRKFLATVLRGVLLALVEFVGVSSLLIEIQLTVVTLVSAFLIGAGFDVVLKRGQGALETSGRSSASTSGGGNL